MGWFVLAKLFSVLISLIRLGRFSENQRKTWLSGIVTIHNGYFGRTHLSVTRP